MYCRNELVFTQICFIIYVKVARPYPVFLKASVDLLYGNSLVFIDEPKNKQNNKQNNNNNKNGEKLPLYQLL